MTTTTSSRNATGLAAAASAASRRSATGAGPEAPRARALRARPRARTGRRRTVRSRPRRRRRCGSTSGRAGPTPSRRGPRTRGSPSPPSPPRAAGCRAGREGVIEQAVGDEAVAPRVPEVVPEREPVVEKDACAGRRGRRGRCPAVHPREERGEPGGHARRGHRLTREGRRSAHQSGRYRCAQLPAPVLALVRRPRAPRTTALPPRRRRRGCR